MKAFTRQNLNNDSKKSVLPEQVWQRLTGIKNAIEALCRDGQLDYDFTKENPDWRIDDENQRERIRGNYKGTWFAEKEWEGRRCKGKDCCKIEIAYHFDPNLTNRRTNKNAIWLRVNGKKIYLYVPLSIRGIRLICFSESNLYRDSKAGRYPFPNFPSFTPPYLRDESRFRKLIKVCDDYNDLVRNALSELCFLCTK